MRIRKIGLATWFNKNIADPFYQILSRDAEPKQLAFSAALGITLGIFPVCVYYGIFTNKEDVAAAAILALGFLFFLVFGVTVLLCGIAIALLGSVCHAPTVMLANFIATPIELSLVVPFLRLGEAISGGSHFPLTSDALKKVLTGQASRDVILSIAHALLGWLAAGPFILGSLYIISLPCFKILVCKFSTVPSTPKKLLNSHAEVRLKMRDF